MPADWALEEEVVGADVGARGRAGFAGAVDGRFVDEAFSVSALAPFLRASGVRVGAGPDGVEVRDEAREVRVVAVVRVRAQDDVNALGDVEFERALDVADALDAGRGLRHEVVEVAVAVLFADDFGDVEPRHAVRVDLEPVAVDAVVACVDSKYSTRLQRARN